ncbi:hypothetical protein SCE1572_39475 [Sorangium cellulosum So0157-2]|uniref:Uncharacterized protein n=1 Tax=Sorangium cellulosum So0157-2 TaxID=1254432 RepID=S4Y6H2_SORCE|nr:hypothetical protein SCE1572_39475 [Sorangium cellulosum So0157-2]
MAGAQGSRGAPLAAIALALAGAVRRRRRNASAKAGLVRL